jgi:hypothetical protein
MVGIFYYLPNSPILTPPTAKKLLGFFVNCRQEFLARELLNAGPVSLSKIHNFYQEVTTASEFPRAQKYKTQMELAIVARYLKPRSLYVCTKPRSIRRSSAM